MSVQSDLRSFATPAKAKASAWFFKTGKGQYGEGDRFIGVTVPEQRLIARRYRDLSVRDIEKLLESPIHEYRLTGLFILVSAYEKVSEEAKKRIYDFYLSHTSCVNNWDLVDSSAGHIVGEWLVSHIEERGILYALAKSKNLWERRIAIIATQAFIKRDDFADTFALSRILMGDTHDLMHKAVGWMLREVGKRNLSQEEAFLNRYYPHMPRTMLRYAIEKFSPQKRAFFMKK